MQVFEIRSTLHENHRNLASSFRQQIPSNYLPSVRSACAKLLHIYSGFGGDVFAATIRFQHLRNNRINWIYNCIYIDCNQNDCIEKCKYPWSYETDGSS